MKSYSSQTTAEEVAGDCKAQIATKTILVTGISPGGLGATFATIIAQHAPACIILASRDVGKAEEVARDVTAVAPTVRTVCVKLDLESLTQVREAAQAINLLDVQIDVIVNNAGIMAPPFAKTADGIERQFATNYVGHFLLTNLLLPKMLARNVPIRVVNLSSNAFRYGPVRLEDWNFDDGKTYNRWVSYAQSKSANMLFSLSLARKLGARGLISVSIHPGVIPTKLSRSVNMEDFGELYQLDRQLGYRSFWDEPFQPKTASQGVATHIFAAFHPSLGSPELNGAYLLDSHVESPEHVQSWGRDAVDAERLWALGEELVSQKFNF